MLEVIGLLVVFGVVMAMSVVFDAWVVHTLYDWFVVTAFAEKLGGKNLVNYIADGNGELTKALGLQIDLSVAQLNTRGVRCSMIVKEGLVIEMNNEESPKLTEVSGASRILS